MADVDALKQGLNPGGENPAGFGGKIDPGNKGHASSDLSDASSCASSENLDFILDIPLEISVELGRTKMMINEMLKLGQGSVIELSKPAGENLEIMANQRLIARGEVVVSNEKYGVRLTEIISLKERIEKLEHMVGKLTLENELLRKGH